MGSMQALWGMFEETAVFGRVDKLVNEIVNSQETKRKQKRKEEKGRHRV
jgi:hypothetical protein